MVDNEPREGSIYWRALDDKREITVYPMSFGKARVCLGYRGDVGYEKGYCYASPTRALEAAEQWDGEGDPLDGWHRSTHDGRRREGGDPQKETR